MGDQAATRCYPKDVTLRARWLTMGCSVSLVSRTGGEAKYVVLQRKAGQVTDVWWNEKEGQLYTYDEARASAAKDNAHNDGYHSGVIEAVEVFED